MNHPMSRFGLLLAATAFTIAGCADLPDVSHEESSPAATSKATLTLDIKEPTHVSGSFGLGDATLVFDFAEQGGVHTGLLRNRAGERLMSSRLEGGVETTSLLDGRLVVSGTPESVEPKVEGDRNLLATVQEVPEMKLLADLRATLTANGVDAELHTPSKKAPLTPQAYFNGWDGYWHLAPGEKRAFATWSFWYPTYINVRNFGASRCATITLWHLGSMGTEVIPANGWRQFQRFYWGFAVTVENLNAWIDWSGTVCGPNEIGVNTY